MPLNFIFVLTYPSSLSDSVPLAPEEEVTFQTCQVTQPHPHKESLLLTASHL